MANNKTEISSFKHQDKRVNIPPQELSAFLRDEEMAPKTMLYPRDPSLDPQLVWKGKDEQDQKDLAVPSVPIYIQEKIQPQAIIENVRKQAGKVGHRLSEPETEYLQLDMFGDFNHIEFEDLVEFYEHEQNWSNRMVLGDSLLVMNSLAEKEGLKGKVQMIYMDPPYGIKFGSNWQSRLRKRGVKDGVELDLSREPEQIKAFRDTWELGIHSYLSYLRDRLVIARELLTETGSIFVQIGDENVHLVHNVMDEVFGSNEICGQIIFQKSGGTTSALLEQKFDYLLWYAKDKSRVKFHPLLSKKEESKNFLRDYSYIQSPDFPNYFTKLSKADLEKNIPKGWKRFRLAPCNSQDYSSTRSASITLRNRKLSPGQDRHWTVSPDRFALLDAIDRLVVVGNSLMYKLFVDEAPGDLVDALWLDTSMAGLSDEKIYVVQTNSKVIERCLLLTSDPGDLVLDPTCGSGTTAFVAEQWGRRWITIDTSRVSIALARMRLMTARYPFYLLSDSTEGHQKEAGLSAVATDSFLSARKTRFGNDLRQGFVYQRVPHITLKSIANNEEIDEIYARWQEKLGPLRDKVNQSLDTHYEDWELPHPSEDPKLAPTKALLEQWWQSKQQRQQEIDASIARRADVELLYDQPYEDRKKIRVCGPFTVESLSPHRVLSTEIERPESEREAERLEGGGKFEQTILENLRVSGVQNTRKSERLNFNSLEAFTGTYLQGSGTYLESQQTKRVAVCIGPEHGTVTPALVREAAKEAMQGIGFDLLVVLGFAFDPHISEEVKQYGKLKVFPARINPDLMMGDLLKKTKAANLFTAYGEPDIDLMRKDGKLVVRLKGVDIFDPTTGEIRSSKPDEIACWFIDDDYNGESFFVRQAYFTGWDEPYEKLRRALRAEVDEGAWESLYREESVPFEPPKDGKIAVKVINDYGDEVLKVFDV
ncbi:MAG: site-specific DNA-methyltransferase [Anaerolineaceae bacterium]